MRVMTNNAKRDLPSTAVVLRALGSVAAVLIAFTLLFGASPVAAGDEDNPEKKSATLGTSKTTKKSKGLAGYASQVKLKKGDSKTISNTNLSRGGTLSQGGGVTTGVRKAPEGSDVVNPNGIPGEQTAQEKWGNEFEEQQKKIADLEKRQKEFNEKASERSDPYNDNPYNRAPGQTSWEDVAREEQAKALEEERKKLEEMRRKARREGVDLPKK